MELILRLGDGGEAGSELAVSTSRNNCFGAGSACLVFVTPINSKDVIVIKSNSSLSFFSAASVDIFTK